MLKLIAKNPKLSTLWGSRIARPEEDPVDYDSLEDPAEDAPEETVIEDLEETEGFEMPSSD